MRGDMTDTASAAKEPSILPEPDPRDVRRGQLVEVWPVEGPLKLRVQGQVLHSDGNYRSLRSTSWNYAIQNPTAEYALAILEVYDSLERLIEQHGPTKILMLLDRLNDPDRARHDQDHDGRDDRTGAPLRRRT